MIQWNASEYARHSATQLAWAHELMARLALAGDECVLDVGCGDGKITAEFAARLSAGRAVGIDASPEMIAFARAAFPPARHPNLEFHRVDARAIDLPLTFDLVFSNAALHWILDQRAALLAMARALRPGGRLVVSCGGRGNAAEALACLDPLLNESQWENHFTGFYFHYHFLGPEEYAPWLAEAGLRVTRLALVPKHTPMSRDDLAAWIRTTWHPYTLRVPETLREEFIAAIVDRYLATHPLDAEGRSLVVNVRLEIEAERPRATTDEVDEHGLTHGGLEA